MGKVALPLWRTQSLIKLIDVFDLLLLLIRSGALLLNVRPNTEVYFGDILMPEQVLNFAQMLVKNDKFWEGISVPVPVTPPLTEEQLAKYPPDIAVLLKGTPRTRTWEEIRERLRSLLTLCDQNVSQPKSESN